MMDALARKWRLYWFRRRFAVFATFFGSMWFGYMYSGWGKNLYTLGYYQGFYQPFDISMNLMNGYGGDEKTKYTV